MAAVLSGIAFYMDNRCIYTGKAGDLMDLAIADIIIKNKEYADLCIHILKSKQPLTDVTQVWAQNVQIFGRFFVKTVPMLEIKSNMKKRVVNRLVVC